MNISVLNWNVLWSESNRNIADSLQRWNADIVCLQELTIENGGDEFTDGDAPRYIAERLGYEYFHKKIDRITGKIPLANGIFSRFPILNTKYTWINESTGAGGFDDEDRALIEVTIKVRDKQLNVATTHMSYTDKFESSQRKSQEADLLVQAISRYEKGFVLTGDLNAPPGSYTINELEKHFKNAGPHYDMPTWTTKPFSYYGFKETELRWRLDHIFATPDLKVVSTEVLKTEYSDHLPLMTTFELD